ncbi:hypothetical protein ECG_00312 [Echinococcus granulosus]|uniref:Expressed conserved protein n=1 Tax=Echinococcus granulosus TaxID=6210 RepID=A0A068WRU0_ECHGR|nr:hypothetical protein ECG_00312 [Echinococcus granulosus]CDS22531.1 expressed conserved protein [Echinococcus granulosus]
MSLGDFDSILISGVTLGFLSSAAFSDSFYKKGLLLGQKAENEPRCLEIVSALPYQLKVNAMRDYNSGSGIRAIGVYKCRSRIDPERKFSFDDYRAMSIDGVELFFLIEAHDYSSLRQKMFQIRPRTDHVNARFIRPISFKILSIDSHINRLYETKNTEGLESIAASVRKACDDVEKHAMDKLEQTTNALSRTMHKIYAQTRGTTDGSSECSRDWGKYDPSVKASNSRPTRYDRSFAGGGPTDGSISASAARNLREEGNSPWTTTKDADVINAGLAEGYFKLASSFTKATVFTIFITTLPVF